MLIPITLISCNSNSKEVNTKFATDFQVAGKFMLLNAGNQLVDNITNEITVDTIIDECHILFKQLPNERVINQHYDYAENSLFADLEYFYIWILIF